MKYAKKDCVLSRCLSPAKEVNKLVTCPCARCNGARPRCWGLSMKGVLDVRCLETRAQGDSIGNHTDKNVRRIGFMRAVVCHNGLCASPEVHRHDLWENAERDIARSRSSDSMSTVPTRRSGHCRLQRGELASEVVPGLFGEV